MNDWLDYKGSGSARSYTGDYIGPSIGHKRRTIIDDVREGIDNAVGRVMDKVTNVDLRAFDARDRQRRADERLKQSQIELKAKEIYDAAGKLRGDAADVRQEGFDYRAKLHNGWKSLATQVARTKDPRALAQLDSAKRNMSNDVLRMEDKIKTKITELYKELSRIEKMYNDFTYSNPTCYVKGVPEMLEESKKYLSEATTLTNEFIANSNKNIW